MKYKCQKTPLIYVKNWSYKPLYRLIKPVAVCLQTEGRLS